MNFRILNSFTKKANRLTGSHKSSPKNQSIRLLGFFNQFPLLLKDTMADIQLGAEGGIKSGRSVWEEKTNRKMWVRNGTMGYSREREHVRGGAGGKGGEGGGRSRKATEKEPPAACPEWRQRSQSEGWDRTKRHQQNRVNKEKQETIRSRFQKDENKSRESKKPVG